MYVYVLVSKIKKKRTVYKHVNIDKVDTSKIRFAKDWKEPRSLAI